MSTIRKEDLTKAVGTLLRSSNYTEAIKQLKKGLEVFPDFVEGWVLCHNLACQMGKLDLAETASKNLISLAPKNLEYQQRYVFSLENSGKLKAAVELAMSVCQTLTFSPFDLTPLTQFLCKHKYYIDALAVYKRQLKLEPNNSVTLLNIATISQYLGDIDAAESYAARSIEADVKNYDAYFFRSHLKRFASTGNNINQLKKIVEDLTENSIAKSKILFSLAKELEDINQFSESFHYRRLGAEIYRKKLNYSVHDDINFIEAILNNYNNEFVAKQNAGYDNNEPIFIVGLPRSGTTLLERIISSHSEIDSEGELNNFSDCLNKSFSKLEKNVNMSREDLVQASTKIDFKSLGEEYIESTRHSTGKFRHFIDKFPQNSLYLGLICTALPNSKIIIMQRHPLDLCYAVYKQMFTEIYQFSYSLEELADYYIAHEKLLTHWKKLYPENIICVKYENIVGDIENESKRVFAFLNVDWQEKCLSFHKNKLASSTASASQVRRSLYSSSIGMWKNYASELKPLINRLESAGCLDGW